MSLRRLFAGLFAIAVLACFAASVGWFLLGGQQKARQDVIAYLKPILGSSFDIAYLDIYPTRAVARGITLDPSPTVHVRIRTVQLDFSFWKTLLNFPDFTGAIDNLEINDPQVTIVTNKSTAPTDSAFQYEPYFVKRLEKIVFVRRIRINNLDVVNDKKHRVWVKDCSGLIDFTDPEHVNANLDGQLPIFGDGKVSLDIGANLTEGSFLIAINGASSNLETIELPEELSKLKIKSGKIAADIEIWGESDLRFGGSLHVDNLVSEWDEKLIVNEGEFDGRLFGQHLSVGGKLAVNGLPIEIDGEIGNLFTGEWSAQLVESNLDLADFDGLALGIPPIKGNAVVDLKVHGGSEGIVAKLGLHSPDIAVGAVRVINPLAKFTYANGALTADTLNGEVLAGRFGLKGSIDPSSGDVEVNGWFRKVWRVDVIPTWVKVHTPTLALDLNIERTNKEWKGGGEGVLIDSTGTRLTELHLTADKQTAKLDLTVPGSAKPIATLTYTPDEAVAFRLNAVNPQIVLSNLLQDNLIPDGLSEYTIRVTSQGDLDNIKTSIDAVSLDGSRGITSAIKIRRDGKQWLWNNNLGLRLPGPMLLAGEFVGTISREQVVVSKGSLSDIGGKKLLQLHGSYNITDKGFKDTKLELDQFPLVALLRMVDSHFPQKLLFDLTADVTADGDSVQWNATGDAHFTDGENGKLNTSGSLRSSKLVLNQFEFTNEEGDSLFIAASGAVNLKNRNIDSLVVMLSAFPISRLWELAVPELVGHISGQVAARLEASGALAHPLIGADIHVTQGYCYGVDGIWGNLSISTGDTLYRLDDLTLGRNSAGWVNAKGWKGNSGIERAHIIGKDVEIGQFVHAVSGVKLPLSGTGNFDFNYAGGDGQRSLKGDTHMKRGSFAHVLFDRVDSGIRITDIDGTKPSLWFDSLKVVWGNAYGVMNGELPLTSSRSIAIRITADGNLTEILPRLDEYFSEPEGNGSFECLWGGNLNHMTVSNGKLKLNQAGIRMNSVIRDFRNVECDVVLDNHGRIRINDLQGTIDKTQVWISNRDARKDKHEENIVVGGFDLGVIQLRTDREGVWIVIPGLMEPEWGGHLALSGPDGIGAFEFSGPAESPIGIGDVSLSNTIFTYPILEGGGEPSAFASGLIDLLLRIRWNARIRAEKGCRYIREISGLGGMPGWDEMKSRIFGGYLDPDIRVLLDLRIDDTPQGLRFLGAINDSLRLSGEITSSQGSVELLDLQFDVEQIGLIFNPSEIEPVIYGSAQTNVVDSMGINREIRLKIKADDSEKLLGEEDRDRAGVANFAIALEDDQGHSQEQIMMLLGYSPTQLPGKLTGLGGKFVEGATPLRKWTRLIERRIEEWTGVDRIAIESSVAQNLIEKQFNPLGVQDPTSNGKWGSVSLLQGSSVTVGKYILPTLYISYTGALSNPNEAFNATRLGIRHDWDALFRIRRISNNLTLNYRYEYNTLARSSINSVFVRYAWVFNLQRQVNYIFR